MQLWEQLNFPLPVIRTWLSIHYMTLHPKCLSITRSSLIVALLYSLKRGCHSVSLALVWVQTWVPKPGYEAKPSSSYSSSGVICKPPWGLKCGWGSQANQPGVSVDSCMIAQSYMASAMLAGSLFQSTIALTVKVSWNSVVVLVRWLTCL